MVDGIGTAGGGEGIAKEIATHLDPAKFDVSFCATRWVPAPRPSRRWRSCERRASASTASSAGSRFDLRPWRRLIAAARRSGVDVLHTHKIGSNVWGAMLSPLLGDPVFVAHEHTWSYEGNPLRLFLDRELIARRADAFVAVSREDQRRMIEVERMPAAKSRFIANGIPRLPASPTPAATSAPSSASGPSSRWSAWSRRCARRRPSTS